MEPHLNLSISWDKWPSWGYSAFHDDLPSRMLYMKTRSRLHLFLLAPTCHYLTVRVNIDQASLSSCIWFQSSQRHSWCSPRCLPLLPLWIWRSARRLLWGRNGECLASSQSRRVWMLTSMVGEHLRRRNSLLISKSSNVWRRCHQGLRQPTQDQWVSTMISRLCILTWLRKFISLLVFLLLVFCWLCS